MDNTLATKLDNQEKVFAEFCRKDPVMLLTMGKVGSSSLNNALNQYYDGKVIRMERFGGNINIAGLRRRESFDFLDYLLARYVRASTGNSPPPQAWTRRPAD